MKLWIDDIRPPPDDSWTWAQESGVAMGIVALALSNDLPVKIISFDHDLGGDDTAMPVAKMIEEGAYRGVLRPPQWRIHSANPVGRMNLEAALTSADRLWAEHQSKPR
jgi:hypothetical protein